jgi:hypothetical protein
MIVGSVLSKTLCRQAVDNGAHRTAGPDHYPVVPLIRYFRSRYNARPLDHFACKGRSVSLNRFRTHCLLSRS